MAKSGQRQETMAGTEALEKRLEELEIKSSFLEKELEEYKEASRGFYRRINELEDAIQKLQKDVQESDLPTPEPTWDPEGQRLRT